MTGDSLRNLIMVVKLQIMIMELILSQERLLWELMLHFNKTENYGIV